MIRRASIGWSLLLLAAGLASAQDAPAPGEGPAAPPTAGGPAPAPKPPPPTPEQAADAVLAAVAAKDDAALKVLAGKDDPDPWLVADEMIRRGQHDAAEGFARAAPRAAVETLPDYVDSRRGQPDDPVRRERLTTMNAALGARKPQQASDAVGAAEAGPIEDVVGVRLALGRGSALEALGRLDEAQNAFLSAADAAERIGWRAQAASAYDLAAISAYRRSAFASALDGWSRALAAQEALGDRAEAAKTLGRIGLAHAARGDHAQALSTYERALVEMEAMGDRAGAARILNNIGVAHSRLGEFARALSTHERALAAREALGDRAGVAVTLGNIGVVQQELGELTKALSAYERAHAAKESVGDRAGAAATLGNIGVVHFRLGEFAKALSAHERALAAMEALGDRTAAAMTLGNIGIVHYALGDDAKALSFHERALAAKEATGDRVGAALTLVNIGNVHLRLGDPETALSTYERALATLEARGDTASSLVTLGNIGVAHAALGNHAKALATYERALAAQEALGDRAGAAGTLSGIGVVHHVLRDHARALSFHERALAAREALGDRAGAAVSLGNIGNSYLGLGDPAKAIDFARRAVVALGHSVRGLSVEEGSAAREPLSLVFDVGATASIAAEDAAALAHFLESGRAAALLENLASREALGSVAIPDALRTEESKALAAETRATAALRRAVDAGDLAATKARRIELEAAQAQVAAVVARIQREAKAGASIVYPQAASLDEIRAALDAGDVLVVYALLEKDAAALVVTRDGARIATLGARAPIDAAAEAAAEALADDEVDAAAPLRALSDLVVKPLALPGSAKRVLVSPSGALSYVPFAALLPDRTVAYVPSGTTYRLLREEEALRGEGVLALGDPDYAGKVDERALAVHRGTTGRLTRLPATRDEALAVGTEPPLLGAEATEARLREMLAKRKRWRAVHLACHGLVNTERPALSSLAITPAGDDDGFLSCLDVFRMKVPADLVVLSACETGKGKVVKGEGIVGLTRAFMFAGSPRVLCSLWKVDDEATSALMRKFYDLWNPKTGSTGLGTAEALRQAQEHVRSQAKWKHPYYWAAWVLWGLPS